MTKNDWYDAGDRIKRLVQDAVDTGDFSQLGNTIRDVVSDTMDGLQDAIRENLGGQNGSGDGQSYGEGYGAGDGAQSGTYASYGQYGSDAGNDQTYRGSADRVRRAYEQTGSRAADSGSRTAGRAETARQTRDTGSWKNDREAARNFQPPVSRRKLPSEMGSKLMKYAGFGMGAFFGAVLAMEAAAAAAIGDFMIFAASGVMTGVFCAGSLLLGANGQKRLGLARRFRRYQEVIGTRTYCMIEELASGIGGTSKFVRKDLKDMIRRGYFPVGYLDRKETLLITDQTTYQQYVQTEEAYEKRQGAQEAREAENDRRDFAARSADGGTQNAQSQNDKKAGTSGQSQSDGSTGQLSPEHQALIEEGQRYIRHIHECNDRIPGKEMTEKLDRLELVVTRIFREAEKNPDAVSDLRKMMSYYLPTTRKLLDAYCDLDDQPIRGQNIETTRTEIEDALDTINTAFENLLDGLYEEQAWDISSDISVLNSMLAQEGLTGDGFPGKSGKKEE
ncbi:MAG: 5-bromo-4-chloroindolyl phosphate hydrolysis family protein [Clostridiales bacterium]|nr:5-bromo-4-chloroindolyl phosphate hydrolysis family protein [Clostridiales bacterium]